MNRFGSEIGGREIPQAVGVKSVAVGESPHPVFLGRHCLLRLNGRNQALVGRLYRGQHGLSRGLSQLFRNGRLHLQRGQLVVEVGPDHRGGTRLVEGCADQHIAGGRYNLRNHPID